MNIEGLNKVSGTGIAFTFFGILLITLGGYWDAFSNMENPEPDMWGAVLFTITFIGVMLSFAGSLPSAFRKKPD